MLLRFRNDYLTPLVRDGSKRATYRAKARPVVGQRLTLMYGSRRLLNPDPVIAAVEPLRVITDGGFIAVEREGRELDGDALDALCAELGHPGPEAAAAYYLDVAGPDTTGHVIRW